MDINELPLVDASSIVDFAAVSARGILCAKDGLISERSPNGETISEVARSRKDRVQCMVLVPGKELRLWVGMSSGYVHVYAVDHNSQPSTERVNDSFGACRAEKLAHSGPVSCIISHGRRVYTGSGDKYIFEWHAATMELLRTLPTQRGAVRALAAIGLVLFSSDSTDHSIRCWNLNTCEPAGKLTGHKAVVRSIMYHLQNGTLWTGAEDGKIVIWDVGEQRMLTTLTHHTHSVTSLCQTSSGYSASAGLDSMMCIYTARTPTAPVCIRQINVPSIMTILPVCEEDENVLLWCVRKRLGSKLFELSGHSPATAEMDREAVPPRSTKKRPPAVKRSPSAVHTPASTRDSSVRGRSPAPVKRRGQSPSPGPASRRPSPGRLPMQRQDSVQSAQQQQKQARLQEELTVVSEENKVLRRQLLQTQAEMAKERRSFESQLQHLADKEGAVTNTLYRATNNVADMLGMVKRLAITRPEVKNEMKDLLKCILDTNRVIREMGGGGGGGSNSTRRTSSIPSPLKYGRFRSPSPRGRRGSASPHSMSHSPRSRDTNQYATRSDAASLTSTDGRMPVKRGAWDAPSGRSIEREKEGLPVSMHQQAHEDEEEERAMQHLEAMEAKRLFEEERHDQYRTTTQTRAHQEDDDHHHHHHHNHHEDDDDDEEDVTGDSGHHTTSHHHQQQQRSEPVRSHYEGREPEPDVEPEVLQPVSMEDPQKLRLANIMKDLGGSDDDDESDHDDRPLVEDDHFLGGLLDKFEDEERGEDAHNTLDLSMSVGNEPPAY